jgi:hypothetical protein
MNLVGWNDPDPAEVFHPTTDAEWDTALGRYLGSRNDRPLRRCVEVARSLGAVTLVVETRYLDPDYRSEFSNYYSKQFADIPDSTHRLHFFSNRLTKRSLWRAARTANYLGYVVVRPASTGLVSRAMIPPPPALELAVRTSVTETVSFFGQDLDVTGVPFAQQDAQLGACAQAAAWMCHFSASLRRDALRRPKADFTLKAPASLHPSRAIPSGGLTVLQLGELFRTLELPALHYEIGRLPSPGLPWQPADPTPPSASPNQPGGLWDSRIVAVACRHLNSGNPVLVGTRDHAFILCGYQRKNTPRPSWIEFVRHDDQEGPYGIVRDVLGDVDPDTGKAYGPWQTMQVPMPEKVWLAPEVAERRGGVLLRALSNQVASAYPGKPFLDLDELIAADRLRVHTYATRSSDFKSGLSERGLATNIRRAYAFARLSRYIWVVEAIDKDLRDAGLPCVIGEAVLDATSSDQDPQRLAVHVHGLMWQQKTSGTQEWIYGSYSPYRSAGRGPA